MGPMILVTFDGGPIGLAKIVVHAGWCLSPPGDAGFYGEFVPGGARHQVALAPPLTGGGA